MKRYNGVAVWAIAAAAVAIGALVVSPKAPGGLLEPPATPAGTMHTLDEIYVNTASVVVPAEALATARGPAYLHVDGILGGVTTKTHKDWIAIFGFTHDFELIGDYSGGGASKVQMNSFAVIKELDRASPKLSLACCNGAHIRDVKIEWPKDVEGRLNLRVTLQDVMVTSISPRLVYRGDGFVLMENVAFTFAKITWEYWDEANAKTTAYWDLKTNTGG